LEEKEANTKEEIEKPIRTKSPILNLFILKSSTGFTIKQRQMNAKTEAFLVLIIKGFINHECNY